ncbi:MAG TPA: ROK family protein [Dongiaceae bacterium]|jgi:predicted NBD/HSP70 family sugar kinase
MQKLSSSSAASAGQILALILSQQASTRPDIERASGLSRATVAHRLEELLEVGLIDETAERRSSGGRPARILKLNEGFAVTLAADIGESFIRVAVTDLAPRILAEQTVAIDVASGPQPILGEIARCGRALLRKAGRKATDVLGIGLSLPAPVDHEGGRVVGPSVMRQWDNFDIRGWLEQALGIDALIDNDVNLLALSEHRRFWPAADHFFFVKAGTGIGSGIVTRGQVYRGGRGASGDIGHIQFDAPKAPLCRCGKLGCVEARAAGWAIARDLRALGFEGQNARDVMALLDRGTPECIQRIREAGRVLGEVLADVVSILNPTTIVIGGTLSEAGEHLIAGIREMIYQRCLPLAIEGLGIHTARSDDRAGILGAAQLVIDAKLQPAAIAQTVAKVVG